MRFFAAWFCLLLAEPALASEVEAPPAATEEALPPAPVGFEAEAKGSFEFNSVELRGLNKVTGRTASMKPFLGIVERFGTLEIIPRRCWQSAAGERPESVALLEIWELKAGEGPVRLFLGWMFLALQILL